MRRSIRQDLKSIPVLEDLQPVISATHRIYRHV